MKPATVDSGQSTVDLSVIIVNYNVEHFLEQCLHSVREAAKRVEAEIFVVDNNSVDGSVEMIRKKFPEVKLIANKENVGFSKANNQAIREKKGEYILLLNPDTVVEADTFEKIVRFMEEHPDAGGLGIQMLDGKGNFLPESKRGLPTPQVAFYKIFGLSALFPKSKRFGKYHLGYLDRNETHEVDVLSGAFMLLRKSVLDKIGLLDEDYFMYGEDIDLSYRIIKAGFKNYYYPEARIIHYKGESTKKSSVNFVFVFYRAMVIFAQKHFSQQNARTFSFLINFAIYIRAAVSIIRRFLQRIILPLVDALIIFAGIFGLSQYWEESIKISEGVHYPREFYLYVVPSYILVWLLSVFLSGGYDKPVRLLKILRGLIIGTGVILVIYALLPEHVRFSRALILLGAFWAILSMMGTRLVLHLAKVKGFDLNAGENKRIAIVDEQGEAARVNSLLTQTGMKPAFVGFVSPENDGETLPGDYLGSINQLREVVEIYGVNEVIFCAKNLPAQSIIDRMARLGKPEVEFKIAPPESLYIIGSNSINTAGDFYTIDINSISKPVNRRNKRLLDIIAAVILLPLFPVLLFLVDRPLGYLKNCLSIIAGKKSWVGYYLAQQTSGETQALPAIRPGVLNPLDVLGKKVVDAPTIARLNMLYAKDYKPENDLNIIVKSLRELGRM